MRFFSVECIFRTFRTTARHQTNITQPTNVIQYTTGENLQLQSNCPRHMNNITLWLLTTLTSTSNSMTMNDTTQNYNKQHIMCLCLQIREPYTGRVLVLNKTELSSTTKLMTVIDLYKYTWFTCDYCGGFCRNYWTLKSYAFSILMILNIFFKHLVTAFLLNISNIWIYAAFS